MFNVTIEDVDKVWDQFVKYTEEAEQYQFPSLALIQSTAEPLYNDLHKNWNEEHAAVFILGMNALFKKYLGISGDVTADA